MNIEQALKRIDALSQNIADQDHALFAIKDEEIQDIKLKVTISKSGNVRDIFFSYPVFAAAIEVSIEKNQTELAELKKAVKHARSAQKGALS